VLWPAVVHAAPPDFHEVPAALRTGPSGHPLTDEEKQQLSDRKILAEVVNDAGPEPWPGIAVALVDATPKEMFAVLRDYPHFHEFMPYVQSVTVDEHSGKRWVVSYVIKGPMGIGNRDYQMEVFDEEDTQDGVTYLISRFRYTGKGNIKSTVGTWKLVPIWGGKVTFVRYEVRTDIGGGFTQWLKRKLATSSLPRVITAVRKRLTETAR
jgi:ribosome-associated toxin RatA of RatAB toxin-antitoxin module